MIHHLIKHVDNNKQEVYRYYTMMYILSFTILTLARSFASRSVSKTQLTSEYIHSSS